MLRLLPYIVRELFSPNSFIISAVYTASSDSFLGTFIYCNSHFLEHDLRLVLASCSVNIETWFVFIFRELIFWRGFLILAYRNILQTSNLLYKLKPIRKCISRYDGANTLYHLNLIHSLSIGGPNVDKPQSPLWALFHSVDRANRPLRYKLIITFAVGIFAYKVFIGDNGTGFVITVGRPFHSQIFLARINYNLD